jgi:hypothetical protein
VTYEIAIAGRFTFSGQLRHPIVPSDHATLTDATSANDAGTTAQ